MPGSPPGNIESRRRPRFVMSQVVSGRFSGYEVTLLDISESGARVEHADRINLGAHSVLQVTNPVNGDSMQMEGVVRWSRLSIRKGNDGQHVYESAIAFTRIETEAHLSLARLVTGLGAHDSASLEQKRRILLARERAPRVIATRGQITADQLELIRWARETLQVRPEEALKWYQRSRFSQEALEAAGGTVRYKDEVLAVWELLQRRVPVQVIALAFDTEQG